MSTESWDTKEKIEGTREAHLAGWARRLAAFIRDQWRRRRADLGVLLLYVVVTLVVTYPVVLRLSSHIAGYPGDSLAHLWSLWWGKKAMLDLRTSMADLSYFYHPWGAYHPLLAVTPLIQVTELPLALLFRPLVAYNLTFLSSFVLTAFTTYLLCLKVVRDRRAAFVGGLIFGFAPHRAVHGLGGHLAQIITYWFPLYALSVLKLMRRPSWKNGVWVGILLGISALVNFVHTAYFVSFFTLYWLFYYFVVHRRRFLTVGFLKKVGLALMIAIAITAPFFVPFIKRQFTAGPAHITEPGLIWFSINPLSFVLPSPLHPLVKHIGATNAVADLLGLSYAENTAFIGVIPLVLSVWAVSKRRRQASFWLGFAILTAVLALGPVLKWGGEPIKIPLEGIDIFIPLPYLFLHFLPGFNLGRTPARISEGTAMALAVLVGLGMAQLLTWLEKREKFWMARLAVAVVSALTLFEYCVIFPYLTAPLDTPAFYQQVRQEEGEFAILDYPLNIRSDLHEFKRPMYYQTTHERPIVGGKVWRFLPEGERALLWVDNLLNTRELLHPTAFPIEWTPEQQRGWLSTLGFRYLVLHKYDLAEMLPVSRDPQLLKKEKAYFTDLLSAPIYQDDAIIVFPIPESKFVPGPPLTALATGWYGLNGKREWRWAGQKAQIDVDTESEAAFRIAFNAWSFDQPRRLLFSVNGEPVYSTMVHHDRRFITPAFHLQTGINEIGLEAQGLCTRPIDIDPTTADANCLTFNFSQMEWVSVTETYGDYKVQAQFGDYFRLLGYDLDTSHARPGGHVKLALYWEVLKPPDRDYTVFTHLRNAQGEWGGQKDKPPMGGVYPTTWLGEGAIVRDEYRIPIPEYVLPGQYDLSVGWYHLPTGDRLPLRQETAADLQEGLVLTQVEIVAE